MSEIRKSKKVWIALLLLTCLLTTSCSNYHLIDTNKKYSWDTGTGERLIKEYRENQEKRKQQFYNSSDKRSNEDWYNTMQDSYLRAAIAR